MRWVVSRYAKGDKFFYLAMRFFFLFIILLPTVYLAAQNIEQKLVSAVEKARTEREQVNALGELSNYYYSQKNFQKGDSILEKRVQVAEATRDKGLIIEVLFKNPVYESVGSSTKDRSKKAIAYITKALEYARNFELNDYAALAYSNLAKLYSSDGDLQQAFNYAMDGLNTASMGSNDSVKVLAGLQLGDVYLKQGKIVNAYKSYYQASDIALKSTKEALQSPVYRSFSNLYKKLLQEQPAKDFILRSLQINTRTGNVTGVIEDYISLGQLYDYVTAKDYLSKAEKLADSIQNNKLKLDAERKLFSYMMLQEKPAVTIAYLEKHPDLQNMFQNTGPNYIDWIKASVYLYGNDPDAALTYFKTAEHSFEEGYEFTAKKGFFEDFAYCYRLKKDIPNAIKYYTKTIELSKSGSDFFRMPYYAKELKTLYAEQGDFQKAYYYGNIYDHYKDTIDQLARERDLALLEIDTENKIREQQLKLAADEELRMHNLQYLGITVFIAVTFLMLIVFGMFKVSQITIRALGFLSFIFLFEFIIMLLDKRIHDLTHGEPLKIWLIKIGIISLLLPFHHYIEHKLIQYLLSRKLLHIRRAFSFREFMAKLKGREHPEQKEEVKEEVPASSPPSPTVVVNYTHSVEDK